MKKISICLMLIISLILSACGTTNEEMETETEKGSATETSGTDSTEVTTVKFATWDYSSYGYLQNAINEFEETHPKIKVEVIDIPSTDYETKLPIMLASGDDVDVMSIKTMASYSSIVGKEQALELSSLVEEDNLNMEPYLGADKLLELNGGLFSLPFRNDSWLLYYNKTMFDNAGIDYPTKELTWSEYREIAKKLTTGEGNEKIYGTHTHTWLSPVANWALVNSGHTLVDGNYDFMKKSYELALGIQNEDESTMDYGSLKTSNTHYSGLFYNERIAMLPMGSWFINMIIETKNAGDTNVEWGVAPVPHYEDEPAGNTVGIISPIAINKYSEKQEAAWELTKFLCYEEGATILAESGTMPAYKTDEIINIVKSVEGFPAEGGEALSTKVTALEIPPNENAGAIDKIIQEEHELIMLGVNSIDVGINTMNERVQELLNQ